MATWWAQSHHRVLARTSGRLERRCVGRTRCPGLVLKPDKPQPLLAQVGSSVTRGTCQASASVSGTLEWACLNRDRRRASRAKGEGLLSGNVRKGPGKSRRNCGGRGSRYPGGPQGGKHRGTAPRRDHQGGGSAGTGLDARPSRRGAYQAVVGTEHGSRQERRSLGRRRAGTEAGEWGGTTGSASCPGARPGLNLGLGARFLPRDPTPWVKPQPSWETALPTP